jgi:predicted acylesterase/phospholipase RssA
VGGLRAAGVLRDETPVAGASAGSLIAAVSKMGLSDEQLLEATLELAAECRWVGGLMVLGSPVWYAVSACACQAPS